jgi:DNA glycosylase AlkZ-like
MTPRTLTERALNRALLARQLLLARASLSTVDAVEQLGGLQTQYSPAGYVGLWSRLRSFRRDALTAALEDRSLVQATLMRTTIHTVSGREFWLYARGIRDARRAAATRIRTLPAEEVLRANSERLAAALSDGPKSVKELDGLASGFLGTLGLWVNLVRVPPSGTWERRRADRLGLAETWVGPCDATEQESLTHLVRAHLRAFGPAAWKDIAGWAGVSVAEVKRGGANLTLVPFRDGDGRELVDLPDGPLPDETTPAPARFLAHFDNATLVHFRRAGILPEEHRTRIFNIRNPFPLATVLVDGRVVGGWSVRDGRVVLEPFEELAPRDRDAVEDERAALEAFYA